MPIRMGLPEYANRVGRTGIARGAIAAVALAGCVVPADADDVTFFLNNVITSSGRQMTGTFVWTYDAGDFENGTGLFAELVVPHTSHGLSDLIVTIEPEQIEITLDGSFHDDGVDVTLRLTQPFSPTASALLNLDPAESKYSIGGNGFIEGHYLSGSITPVMAPCPADFADDFGNLGGDGMVSFGDFLAMLGLIGPCPGGTPGCTGDIADDFGNLGGDGMVSFGDFLALLGLIGPC